MAETPKGMKPCYVREARGDGFGVITAPKAMQPELRDKTLAFMTDWALTYLYHCGHHPEELKLVGPSLHDALAKWWDTKNAFADPSDPPANFPNGKGWNVFWAPSTQTIDVDEDAPTEDA